MTQLIDRFGRPLERESLKDLQTAQVAWLNRTVANHPTRGLTPQRVASILQEAELGDVVRQCELFEDMEEKDGHLLAEISKRKRALLTLNYSVEPPRNATPAEQKLADQLDEMIEDLPGFEDLVFDMMDAVGKGYSRIEMQWAQYGSDWLPKAFHFRDPGWFQTPPEDRNQVTLRDGTYTGAPLQPFGWIAHNHRAKSGYIFRGGLYRALCWPFLLKNMALRDLAEFLEIYGLPARIGKYPPGASEKEKLTLLRAVTALGHDAAGIMPQGMMLEFMAAAEGQADPFELMMTRCDLTMSKAILGATLTSQADGESSTNALGNVHEDVRIDLRNSDAKQVAATLTRDLLFPLAVLNSRTPVDPQRAPRLVFDTRDPADMKLYSEALPQLVGMGMQIEVSWAHEKLCIPLAEQGAPVLQPLTAAVPPMALRYAALRGNGVTQTEDELEGLIGNMGDEWEKVTTPIRDQLQALAAECHDLAEFQRRLPELAELLDVEALQRQIAEGAFVARVFGRAQKP